MNKGKKRIIGILAIIASFVVPYLSWTNNPLNLTGTKQIISLILLWLIPFLLGISELFEKE